jgi:hypothetical protein
LMEAARRLPDKASSFTGPRMRSHTTLR